MVLRVLSDRYELRTLLGRGGMAEVWQGYDRRLSRPVAVKILHQDAVADPTLPARFDREARTVAALSHPNIVAVHDVGADDGLSYLVMELVEGGSLATRLADGPLPIAEAVRVAIGVCAGLETAAAAGVVHRDVKPANILFTAAGQVKVCDFGIARVIGSGQADLTGTAQIIGTSSYMAPEQVTGDAVDARTDLYGLGCVLYAMLTGRPPFTGDSPFRIAWLHVESTPAPASTLRPGIPAGLDDLLQKLLAKSPADRPAAPGDARTALEQLDLDAGAGAAAAAVAGAGAAAGAAAEVGAAVGAEVEAAAEVGAADGAAAEVGAADGAAARAEVGAAAAAVPEPMRGAATVPTRTLPVFTDSAEERPGMKPGVLALIAAVLVAGVTAIVLANRPDQPGPQAAPTTSTTTARPVTDSAAPATGAATKAATVVTPTTSPTPASSTGPAGTGPAGTGPAGTGPTGTGPTGTAGSIAAIRLTIDEQVANGNLDAKGARDLRKELDNVGEETAEGDTDKADKEMADLLDELDDLRSDGRLSGDGYDAVLASISTLSATGG